MLGVPLFQMHAIAAAVRKIGGDTVTSSVSYRDEVVNDSPIMYFRMEETSGTTATNEMGTNGTYTGSPQLGQSGLIKSGNAVFFDGSDDSIETGDSYSSMSDIALCTWISTTINDQQIAAYNENQNNIGSSEWVKFFLDSNGVPNIGVWDGSQGLTTTGITAVDDGNAHFVVARLSSGNLYIYVDGQEEGSKSISPSIGTGYWHIGKGAGSGGSAWPSISKSQFEGTLDEFAIYHSSLEHYQVTRQYYAGIGFLFPFTVPSNGIISYWKLDEQSGSTLVDKMGVQDGSYGSATQKGEPSLLEGGNSAYFNQTTDAVVTIPYNSAFPTNQISIALLLKVDSDNGGGYSGVVGNTSSGSWNDGWGVTNNAGPYAFWINGYTTNVSVPRSALEDDEWHYLVGTFDGSDLRLYLDGELKDELTGISWTNNVSNSIQLGTVSTAGSTYLYKGNLDEVSLYDYALPHAEVLESYYAMLGEVYSVIVAGDNPVAYWRLSESSGTEAIDELGANNATYNGSPILGVGGLITEGGSAVELDGSDDSLETYIVGLVTAFSLELWMSAADGVGQGSSTCLFGQRTDSSGAELAICWLNSDGTLTLMHRNDNSGTPPEPTTSAVVDDSSPHHIVMTIDGSSNTIKLYVDGTEEISDSFYSSTGDWSMENAPVAIGAEYQYGDGSPKHHLACTVDEVAFYDTVLSSLDITKHFNTGTDSST